MVHTCGRVRDSNTIIFVILTSAWRGSWLALFATFGYATSFGVYQDLYTRGGTSSSSNISWIGSLQLFFVVIMGLPAGALLDRGYFRPVVLTGTVIYIFRYA